MLQWGSFCTPIRGPVWKPIDRKVYINFVADEGEARIANGYNALSFERLRTIKAKYDSGNLFRMNQNIRPALG